MKWKEQYKSLLVFLVIGAKTIYHLTTYTHVIIDSTQPGKARLSTPMGSNSSNYFFEKDCWRFKNTVLKIWRSKIYWCNVIFHHGCMSWSIRLWDHVTHMDFCRHTRENLWCLPLVYMAAGWRHIRLHIVDMWKCHYLLKSALLK